MKFNKYIKTKQLKDILPYINGRVVIWQDDAYTNKKESEKIFEGWATDIPWQIMNYWLTSNDGDEPIDMRMVENDNGNEYPALVVTVCEDKDLIE